MKSLLSQYLLTKERIIKKEKTEGVIYFFTLKQLKLILSQAPFYFYRKGYLDKKLIEMNWGCYIFQKRKEFLNLSFY